MRTVAETSAEQLGTGRRWVAAVQESVADSIRNLNRTVTSMVLRTLGYVPGPQLPLEFGGYLGDFSVAGAKQLPHEAMVTMLHAEIGAAGPCRARCASSACSRAKPRKAAPGRKRSTGTTRRWPGCCGQGPRGRRRQRRARRSGESKLLGEVELGGSLANLTLRSRDGAAAASAQGTGAEEAEAPRQEDEGRRRG